MTNEVEWVEALTIVLASRLMRPWRSEMIGTVANLLLLIVAGLLTVFGTRAALRSDA
jgi:uncharacterized membrane protein